jgi:hypothetical protein
MAASAIPRCATFEDKLRRPDQLDLVLPLLFTVTLGRRLG